MIGFQQIRPGQFLFFFTIPSFKATAHALYLPQDHVKIYTSAQCLLKEWIKRKFSNFKKIKLKSLVWGEELTKRWAVDKSED